MKKEGKEVFFEALVDEEKACIEAAEFAVEHGFDYLMGVEYFDSITDIIKDAPIKFIPSCGKKDGMPRKLYGTIEEIGERIGEHTKRIGMHINFAPVVDININPANPIIGNRSFGEDKNNVIL